MLNFTLDTNCVIDVDEGRPNGAHIRRLANAHADNCAEVAVIAMMASEKQKSGGYLRDFGEFQKRMSLLNLDHLNIALPLCYFDICFFDYSLLADDDLIALDSRIHSILFPNIENDFVEFCRNRELDPDAGFVGKAHEWRNAKCDVQAVWSHINRKADVFVTSDRNFFGRNSEQLILLGAKRILSPKNAAELV